jgi:hypothetical protein
LKSEDSGGRVIFSLTHSREVREVSDLDYFRGFVRDGWVTVWWSVGEGKGDVVVKWETRFLWATRAR